METNPSLSTVKQCLLFGYLSSTGYYFSNSHINPELITRTDEKNNKGERARKGKQNNTVSDCLCSININEYKILLKKCIRQILAYDGVNITIYLTLGTINLDID